MGTNSLLHYTSMYLFPCWVTAYTLDLLPNYIGSCSILTCCGLHKIIILSMISGDDDCLIKLCFHVLMLAHYLVWCLVIILMVTNCLTIEIFLLCTSCTPSYNYRALCYSKYTLVTNMIWEVPTETRALGTLLLIIFSLVSNLIVTGQLSKGESFIIGPGNKNRLNGHDHMSVWSCMAISVWSMSSIARAAIYNLRIVSVLFIVVLQMFLDSKLQTHTGGSNSI